MARKNCANSIRLKLREILIGGGTSITAAVVLNRTPATLRRYTKHIYAELRAENYTCPCGQEIGHVGSCVHRQALDAPRAICKDYRPRKGRRARRRPVNAVRELPSVSAQARMKDELYNRISSAVSYGVPFDIRDDIISEVYLAALQDEGDIKSLVKKYTTRVNADYCNRYKFKSMDETFGEGDERSLHNTLGQEMDIWADPHDLDLDDTV